jgi:hypothetical protein
MNIREYISDIGLIKRLLSSVLPPFLLGLKDLEKTLKWLSGRFLLQFQHNQLWKVSQTLLGPKPPSMDPFDLLLSIRFTRILP